MKYAVLKGLMGFLNDLDRQRISYSLKHDRDESIMVEVPLPVSAGKSSFCSMGRWK